MTGRTGPTPRGVLAYGVLGIIPFWSLPVASVLGGRRCGGRGRLCRPDPFIPECQLDRIAPAARLLLGLMAAFATAGLGA